MPGTRLSSFVVVFVLIISWLGVKGQRHCAGFNQYCQMHSDCCSNSCQTFLYRCAHNYNGIYPYTFFGEKTPSESTLDEVLEITFADTAGDKQNRRTQQNLASQLYAGPHVTYRKYRQADTATAGEGPGTASADNVEAAGSNQSNSNAADCKVIGLKCYTDDECCSKRCHGFLHQCVT